MLMEALVYLSFNRIPPNTPIIQALKSIIITSSELEALFISKEDSYEKHP